MARPRNLTPEEEADRDIAAWQARTPPQHAASAEAARAGLKLIRLPKHDKARKPGNGAPEVRGRGRPRTQATATQRRRRAAVAEIVLRLHPGASMSLTGAVVSALVPGTSELTAARAHRDIRGINTQKWDQLVNMALGPNQTPKELETLTTKALAALVDDPAHRLGAPKKR